MVVFLLSNVVFALVIDRVAFEGRITKMQWAGIGMAVASLVVLELGKAPE
jgi:multidrug transporter EmrE-like cation transporter